jgi:hypothetical protein
MATMGWLASIGPPLYAVSSCRCVESQWFTILDGRKLYDAHSDESRHLVVSSRSNIVD